jgi:hypothetical protein
LILHGNFSLFATFLGYPEKAFFQQFPASPGFIAILDFILQPVLNTCYPSSTLFHPRQVELLPKRTVLSPCMSINEKNYECQAFSPKIPAKIWQESPRHFPRLFCYQMDADHPLRRANPGVRQGLGELKKKQTGLIQKN